MKWNLRMVAAQRDIWLLRLRALLARARGDEVAYRDYRDRYRETATSLGFDGPREVGRGDVITGSAMPTAPSRNRRDMRVSKLGLGATMNAAEYQHV